MGHENDDPHSGLRPGNHHDPLGTGFPCYHPWHGWRSGGSPIYKSIAEDGSTVFTDQPTPEATVVKPAPLNIMDSPATQPTVVAVPTTVLPKPAIKEIPIAVIDSVVIEHPLHDQTFVDPQEQIPVEFSTTPASSLPVGLTANVWLDDYWWSPMSSAKAWAVC